MSERYRADQVGSLLRPSELIQARAALSNGQMSLDQLRKVEDHAILDALQLQREAGVEVFTDGEYRRGLFLDVLTEAVDGFTAGVRPIEWRAPGGKVETVKGGKIVDARLRQRRRLAGHESAFLKSHCSGPFKITLPTPAQFMFAGYQQGVTDQFYPRRTDLTADLVAILQDEIKALVKDGVPYIQMDAPSFTDFVDERYRARMRESGLDPEAALDEALTASNDCFAGAKNTGVTTAIHLCRGNQRSRWLKEGSYDAIAEKIFGTLDVDRFLLEYDSVRAGGFEPLRFVPQGKTVVLGLVTTKTPELEPIDELVRRVEEASRFIPIERLAVSPQCGFASMLQGNLLSHDDQRRKLELVVEVARKVWG
jgi:5-methyltetrahydropteroyltriglutamate--homocysteine methyltransferase